MSLSRVLQYSNRRHYLTLAAIAGLSLYLLQRSLADISLVAPHVLGWSATYCGYPILALEWPYTAMPMAWPLILAAQCLSFGGRTTHSLFATADSTPASIAQELRRPLNTFAWSMLRLLPLMVIIANGLAILDTLAILHTRPKNLDYSTWPFRPLYPTVAGFLFTNGIGLIATTRWFMVLRPT